jgi:hypothetical protein
MIEIFKYNGLWRIKIINETLEFKNIKEFEKELSTIIALKEKAEPYSSDRVHINLHKILQDE